MSKKNKWTMEKITAIVLGATGMVEEGVLHECLKHPEIAQLLVINRRPCGLTHEKLQEIIHKDFSDISIIEAELSGYNAGYFCMGVSSVGMKETDYTHFEIQYATFDIVNSIYRFANWRIDVIILSAYLSNPSISIPSTANFSLTTISSISSGTG